jgi:hypothetical protein
VPPFYSKERLTELLNKTMATTLTPQEAQLVLDLLNLYDQAADVAMTDDLPRPDFSAALDGAESNSPDTWQSLHQKCTERTTKPF